MTRLHPMESPPVTLPRRIPNIAPNVYDAAVNGSPIKHSGTGGQLQ